MGRVGREVIGDTMHSVIEDLNGAREVVTYQRPGYTQVSDLKHLLRISLYVLDNPGLISIESPRLNRKIP
jgi:hypothetical protein